MRTVKLQEDAVLSSGDVAARLFSWMETWRTPSGGYNGCVLHRFRNKRMFRIHDTAWTQSAMIRAYVNLFERTGQELWRERLIVAADRQYENIDHSSGKYRHAGHEDDRFTSLVHCALANVALLRAMPFVDAGRAARYLEAVTLNTDKYCLGLLWVESEGAFRFSEVDYWGGGKDRFVINFNTMAIESLLALHAHVPLPRYREIALRVGEWLVQRCDSARTFHEEFLRGQRTVQEDPISVWMAPNGLPYQYTVDNHVPDNCVVLYAGLALRGLAALYSETKNPAVERIMRETVDFVLSMRDAETRLFVHTTKEGRVVKHPLFVAGAGMTLVGLHTARSVLNASWDWSDTEHSLAGRQYANGGFPGFVGKAIPIHNIPVWEDVAATPSWNAQLFEYLSLVATPAVERHPVSALLWRAPGVVYCDGPTMVAVACWRPTEYACLYVANKRFPWALVWIERRTFVVFWSRWVEQMRSVARALRDRVSALGGRRSSGE